MASVFAGLLNEAYTEIDAVFGEAFTAIPMSRTDVNGRSVADATRTQFDGAGVFDFDPEPAYPEGRGKAGNWANQLSGRSIHLDAPIPVAPKEFKVGDRIRRTEGGVTFEILEVQRPETSRLLLVLARIST